MRKSPASSETARWPAALRLLADALAGLPPEAPNAQVWDDAVGLAIERHRVAPQFLQAAGDHMPAGARARLAAEARRNAALALRQKAETLRMTSALDAAGCEPVVFKGWPLAEIAHGGAGQRHAKDIDLWVPAGRFGAAADVLRGLGYQGAADPKLPVAVLVEPRHGTEVELHWRSERFRGWPGLASLPDAAAVHGQGGAAVRVPSPAAGMVCLALHGQQHLWLRLKWLLDIDRLARLYGPDALRSHLSYAAGAGAGGAVAMALRLSAAVFRTPLPPDWPRAGLSAGWIERRTLALIGDPSAAPGTMRARVASRGAALIGSETRAQRMGVLRHLLGRAGPVWRARA